MIEPRTRRSVAAILFALSMTAPARPAEAARQTETAAGAARQRPAIPGQSAETPGAAVLADDQDARETRERLRALLNRQPPAVARVLRLDASLLGNQVYMAPYPALAAFIAQHPEVARNPGFYLDYVPLPADPLDREGQVINMWRNMMEGLAFFCVFLVVTATLAWLIRTLIDYRRWSRLSKVQAEVHSKLLDRFASHEDLLAYIQTPAGRRFLESAPIPLDPGARAVSAPFGRILWSIQAGLVLGLGGVGLLFVSGRVLEEVAQPLFALGVLAIALGAGFVLSAVVSFVLSRRLGLFEPPAVGPAGASEAGR